MPAYVLSKLPLAMAADEEDLAAKLLNRTLAVYRARANGDAAWADSRIASAIAARATIDLPDPQKWIEQVAAETGIRAALLQQIVDLADAGKFDGADDPTTAELLAGMGGKPQVNMALVRP